jgi:ATP-dependent DNA ligase
MPWHNARPRERNPRAPLSFIDPCLPTKADAASAGRDWAHEIKHDGYRLPAPQFADCLVSPRTLS